MKFLFILKDKDMRPSPRKLLCYLCALLGWRIKSLSELCRPWSTTIISCCYGHLVVNRLYSRSDLFTVCDTPLFLLPGTHWTDRFVQVVGCLSLICEGLVFKGRGRFQGELKKWGKRNWIHSSLFHYFVSFCFCFFVYIYFPLHLNLALLL